MSIDAQLHPNAAAAVRGDGVAVAGIDRQLASARDRNEFAAIEDVLAPIVDAAASGDAVRLDIGLGVGRAGKQAGGGVAPGLLGQPLGGQGGGLRGAGDCRVH